MLDHKHVLSHLVQYRLIKLLIIEKQMTPLQIDSYI